MVQLGGRWTGPGQDNIKSLANDLGIQVIPSEVFDDATDNYVAGGAVTRDAVNRIDEIARSIPLEAPWQAPDARELDSQTLHTWLYREFEWYTAEAIGHMLSAFLPEPQDVSFLHAGFYIHSNGGLASILGLEGPAHDSEQFVGGAHSITDQMANQLGDNIRLEHPVYTISQDDEGVHMDTPAGRFSARFGLVTVPPCMVTRIQFDPPLPAAREYFNQRYPIRGKIAVTALYDEPFWRDSGHKLMYTDDLLCWDEGGEDRPYALAGLVSISMSRELSGKSLEDRREFLEEELSKTIGPEARNMHSYHEINWAEQPWCRGCNSYATTGTWSVLGENFRQPFGRVLWAGAEMAERFVGQMDGAVATAHHAADEIHSLLGGK